MKPTVEIVISTGFHVRKAGLQSGTLAKMREAWTFPNPLFDSDQRLREREMEDWAAAKEAGDTFKVRFAFREAPSATIQGFDEDETWIVVPRGTGTATLSNILREDGYEPMLRDARCQGVPIDVRRAPGWEPRDYQEFAVRAMLLAQRGYTRAPTAAGKTVIGVEVIARVGRATLVIAHTTEILDGWKDEIIGNERTKTTAKLEGNFKITRIQGTSGALKAATEGDIILATMQTLYRASQEVFDVLNKRVGLVLNDETHHAPADTFWASLTRLAAKYRLGLTATDKRKDRLDFMLHEVIGPRVYDVPDRVLVQSEEVLLPHVEFVKTEFYPTIMTKDRHGNTVADVAASREIAESSYNRIELIRMMTEDKERNALIVRRVVEDWKAGYICAVLTERVAHCTTLQRLLRAEGMVVEVMKGGGTSKAARLQRSSIKEGVLNGKIDAIIGTSVLDEGVNIKTLSAMHLTCPGNNQGKIIQQVGRIRRPAGKTPKVVRDYIDYRVKAVIHSYQNRRKWYKAKELRWPVTDIDVTTLFVTEPS